MDHSSARARTGRGTSPLVPAAGHTNLRGMGVQSRRGRAWRSTMRKTAGTAQRGSRYPTAGSADVVLIAAIALALLCGLLLNRRILSQRDPHHDAEGLSITDIVEIIPTMSILLLAFILVESFGSWKEARSIA